MVSCQVTVDGKLCVQAKASRFIEIEVSFDVFSVFFNTIRPGYQGDNNTLGEESLIELPEFCLIKHFIFGVTYLQMKRTPMKFPVARYTQSRSAVIGEYNCTTNAGSNPMQT